MSRKEYKLEVNRRECKPRSKRLRSIGAVVAGNGSTVVEVSGSGSQHSHANLATLDKLSADEDGYVYLDHLREGTDDEGNPVWTTEREKIKSCYADTAQNLSEDSGDWEKIDKKDADALQAAKTYVDETALSKVHADTAQKLITFKEGLVIGDIILTYDETNKALKVANVNDDAQGNLYATGGVSAYGFSGTGSGGGTATVDVKQLLSSGTPIATVAGVTLYAPEGGASSWTELTDIPSWLTDDKPKVGDFQNDAGYLTAAALSGYATTYEVDYKDEQVLASVEQNYVKKTIFETYKGEVTSAIANSEQSVKDWVTKGYVTKEYVDAQKITGYGKSLDTNGKYLRLMSESESNSVLSSVIAPYAAYTDQLGATNSTAAVSIYGEVTMENGSLAVAGNVSVGSSLAVTGESRFNGSVYLPGQITFFGQENGIYIEADRSTQSYGTVAFIGIHRSFEGAGTIATVNLDGGVKIWQPMAVDQDPEAGISLRVGGMMKTYYLTVGDMTRPEGYWFASPNGYFGNPSSGLYTSFGDGGIELSQATPYIDFHYGSSTADYTSRLIASEDGVLKIDSATADPALRIGKAYLRYDETNNALYVTGQNGAQVHLYATGGIAAYSGLGSGITQLANLSLTGQLTAASVRANTVESDGTFYLHAGSGCDIILNGNATVDADGRISAPWLTAEERLHVEAGGMLSIGYTDANHGITDLYADGSYVYITVNGKKYKLYCVSVTSV